MMNKMNDRKAGHIFLIGFMGSGKSAVSKRLSKALHMRAVEMDEEIEKAQGMTINEIFATKGEPYFREVETSYIRSLAELEPAVVSCGGGVPMRQENVEAMRKMGTIVLLDAAPATIFQRVRYSKNRPLLNGHMNVGYIASLMEKRSPFYKEAADLTICTDGKKLREITDEIISLVP